MLRWQPRVTTAIDVNTGRGGRLFFRPVPQALNEPQVDAGSARYIDVTLSQGFHIENLSSASLSHC